MTGRYHAPFGQGGSHAIDGDVVHRLLRVALDQGGDYADLFFEYSVSGSYVYDEQILKSARRAVSWIRAVRKRRFRSSANSGNRRKLMS